jgi:transcriptional regulator with XRE-family HTH domain
MAAKKTISPLETMGERIQQLRKNLSLTQADLAKKIGISHTQMARYEIKNIYPPADVLKELADVFGTTIDFLVMGDTESKAKQSLNDAELINQFKKISALPAEEKNLVLKMITAYIRDFNTQQAYAS